MTAGAPAGNRHALHEDALALTLGTLMVALGMTVYAEAVLVVGGMGLAEAVNRLLRAFPERNHISNLSHGIVPETPIAHVERLIEIVRNG